jgi:hypothetical protein
MIAAKIYPITIPANGSFVLPAPADYFKVLSATGAFKVRGDSFGEMGALLAGQGLRGVPFQRLDFIDTSGASNELQVLVAGADFVDDRVTGEVSVIDGGKARTRSNTAMTAQIYCGAVAGQYAHCQLWNPADSGKNAFIEQLFLNGAAAQGVSVLSHNAALSTAAGTPRPQSKKVGGAQSALFNYKQNAAAAIPTGQVLGLFAAPANQTILLPFREPFMLPPGQGIVAYVNSVQNTDLNAVFEFFEEAV